MGTRIDYEYTDAGNYHFRNSIVFAGEMTDALWARIRNACESGEFFIAHQVGLPEVFAWLPGPHIRDDEKRDGYAFDDEDDHCWHRFPDDPRAWELTTDKWEQVRSVEELLAAFEAAAKEGWKVFDPAERFGLA